MLGTVLLLISVECFLNLKYVMSQREQDARDCVAFDLC